MCPFGCMDWIAYPFFITFWRSVNWIKQTAADEVED